MIDLHAHTKYSDGSQNVLELLTEAQDKNLSVFSITDHDTIAAYFEIRDNNLNDVFKGKLITGCEFTSTYNGEIIEILAYGFDIDKMEELISKHNIKTPNRHQKQFALVAKKYKQIGIKLGAESLMNNNTITSKHIYLNVISYPENDSFFLDVKNKENRTLFIRNELYNPLSSFYVDQSQNYPKLELIVAVIKEAGGLSFLAHPFIYSPNIINNLNNIYQNYKLDGIECVYSTFTEEQTNYLIEYANNNNLLKSGGSDYHGTYKEGINLGQGFGDLNIDQELINDWVTHLKSI